jgi:ribose transport system permease protein
MTTTTLDQAKPKTRRFPVRFGISPFDLVPYVLLVILLLAIFNEQPKLLEPKARFIEKKSNAAFSLVLTTVGQSLVILTGGIDLSVGGVISLSNSLAATRMTDDPGNIIVWCVVIVFIGASAGVVNGFIVSVMRVTPFIATLATWSIFSGIALTVLEDPGGKVPKSLKDVVRGDQLFGIPNSVVLIVLIVLIWLAFKRSRWGTRLYAVGSNESHAYLSGIPIRRTKLLAYILSGVFAALAGLYRTVDVNTGSPIAGDPFILQSVAAALVGGISLAGGRGGVIPAIVGAFVMLFINDLLQFMGVSSFYTPMVQGMFLIGAVLLNSVGYRIRLRRALAA